MVQKKERRRRRRIDVALPIKIEYGQKKISTNTKNISTLGTYVEVDCAIAVGSNLELRIDIPNDQAKKGSTSLPIFCQGISFRSHPIISSGLRNLYGIGVFFRAFVQDGEQRLSKYIDNFLLREKRLGKIFVHKRKHRQTKRKPKMKGGRY